MKLKTLIFLIIYYILAAFVATKIKNYDYMVYIYGTIVGVVGMGIVTSTR